MGRARQSGGGADQGFALTVQGGLLRRRRAARSSIPPRRLPIPERTSPRSHWTPGACLNGTPKGRQQSEVVFLNNCVFTGGWAGRDGRPHLLGPVHLSQIWTDLFTVVYTHSAARYPQLTAPFVRIQTWLRETRSECLVDLLPPVRGGSCRWPSCSPGTERQTWVVCAPNSSCRKRDAQWDEPTRIRQET